MEVMPNPDCRYWLNYMPNQSHPSTSKDRNKAQIRAKSLETEHFLPIFRSHQNKYRHDSLSFAYAFTQWEASCHLNKLKLDRSQQEQWNSASDSDSGDEDFPPQRLTDNQIYNARREIIESTVVPFLFALRGFNTTLEEVHQCPLRRNNRAQAWRQTWDVKFDEEHSPFCGFRNFVNNIAYRYHLKHLSDDIQDTLHLARKMLWIAQKQNICSSLYTPSALIK